MSKLVTIDRHRRSIRLIVRVTTASLPLIMVNNRVVIGRRRSLIRNSSEELFGAAASRAVDVLRVYAMMAMAMAHDRQLDHAIRTLRPQRVAIREVASMMASRMAISGGQALVGTAGTWIETSSEMTSLIRCLRLQWPSGLINLPLTIRDIDWLRCLVRTTGRDLFESIRGNLDNSWHESSQPGTKIADAWFWLWVLMIAYVMFLAVLVASAAGTGIGLAIVKTLSAAHGGRSISKASGGEGTKGVLVLFVEPTTKSEINQ